MPIANVNLNTAATVDFDNEARLSTQYSLMNGTNNCIDQVALPLITIWLILVKVINT